MQAYRNNSYKIKYNSRGKFINRRFSNKRGINNNINRIDSNEVSIKMLESEFDRDINSEKI